MLNESAVMILKLIGRKRLHAVINSLSSSLWHNTSLKQQLNQNEDDYEILPLEICNYKLVVVLSLVQHIFKTTVEPKRGRLRVCIAEDFKTGKPRIGSQT